MSVPFETLISNCVAPNFKLKDSKNYWPWFYFVIVFTEILSQLINKIPVRSLITQPEVRVGHKRQVSRFKCYTVRENEDSIRINFYFKKINFNKSCL